MVHQQRHLTSFERMPEPVGEDGWLAHVEEASRSASDLEQRIEVVELYKRAIAAEPWSCKIWLAYCEWVWSLHTDCQNGDAGWPEEEQLLGQELFSEDMALDVWQEGSQATQYRINDSNEVWDRWIALELEKLSKPSTEEGIEHVPKMFLDRLQIPHATWDQTSQAFSTFISQYDEASYEATMVQTTQLAKQAKDLYAQREDHEHRLRRAADAGDKEAETLAMREYLKWEMQQVYKKPKKGAPRSPPILVVALFERALASTSLSADASIWENYIVFLESSIAADLQIDRQSIMSAAQRATAHCPWSGMLWARYMLTAENESLPFSAVEQIKHSATSTGFLDRDGLEAVMEVYIAWCGFLKRRTMVEGADDEDIDLADVGLPSAIESVQEWGKRLYGARNYKGDPLFRLEQIFIQYSTQRGEIEQTRAYWKRLVKSHGHSYEFWQQYYLWEMIVRDPKEPPSHATAVLSEAVRQRGLDWPEKMMDVYLRHCQVHVDAPEMLRAKNLIHTQAKTVANQRQREAAGAAANYGQQRSAAEDPIPTESPTGASKRKRDATEDEDVENIRKKVKNAESTPEVAATNQQALKRDRENTTVLITNLPPECTKLKLRQFFKNYGEIYNVTLQTEADKLSSSALIEFQTHDDVQSALLRDGKDFDGNQIHVEVGTGLTIYVTNYPPEADEVYMRKLFGHCGEILSIRFPSLKYNTQRRFCYISFKSASAAAEATKLDGKSLEGRFKLLAKYSDPPGKKAREGATAEGRELHISSIDTSLGEDDLKEIFGKYGRIEKVNLLKTISGESKGAAFVSFEKKEEAESALELDKTKLKAKILKVEVAVPKNFKPTAVTRGTTNSASPAPTSAHDDGASPGPDTPTNSHANTHALHEPSKSDSAARTITLMNLPDTVNDARVRAISESFGAIATIKLRPDHQGAIVEFEDVSAAGRASLGLENHEIAPGRKLRTGGLKDLFQQRGEFKTDKIQIGQGKRDPARFLQPNVPIKRPGARGGLGTKRGLGYSAAKAADPSHDKTTSSGVNGDGQGEEKQAPKSNADFRAMLTKGK